MNAVKTDSGTRTNNCSGVATAGTHVGTRTAMISAVVPMTRPAKKAAPSPRRVTAPIVPLGTLRLRLVMSHGLLLLNTPTSLANVSALVVATAPMKPANIRNGHPASMRAGTRDVR